MNETDSNVVNDGDVNNDNEMKVIAAMKQKLSKFETNHGRLHGLSYQPNGHDIAICTSPKCGTTWVQQICHQLRCAGAGATADCMKFTEISCVVPWIELAYDCQQALGTLQMANSSATTINSNSSSIIPQLYKTHCWYNHCPSFPKTIVVIRNPCDVVVSFYKFFENWFFAPGTISLDTFVTEFWLSRGIPDDTKLSNASYFIHLISWYKQRTECSETATKDQRVLFVCYEDMMDDLKKQVRRIAKFMSSDDGAYDYTTDPSIVEHAVAHSTYAYMKRHETQFNESLTKLHRNIPCGLASIHDGSLSSKVRTGGSGNKKLLSDALHTKIQQKWTDVVQPVTACSTYDELRAQINQHALY